MAGGWQKVVDAFRRAAGKVGGGLGIKTSFGWTPVTSSNVAAVRYDWSARTLDVAYSHGGVYRYGNISRDMAYGLLRAPSKVTWIWNHLRVRGTVNGHRTPFWRVG